MKRIASRRPAAEETSVDYHRQLIEKVEGDCVIEVLDHQQHWLCDLAGLICTEQADKVHPPYGWTIRQVFAHCAEAERIFGYRMLRTAAGDTTPLAGFDENAYAKARFGLGTFTNLVSELGVCRTANLLLLRRIEPAAWDRRATIDGNEITLRGLAWVTAAHLQHHLTIVQRRCGVAVAGMPY